MSIKSAAEAYKKIKQSDIAIREDSFVALKAMGNEELARLAFELLETLEDLNNEGYDYLVRAIEDHIETPGPDFHVVGKMSRMWIIAQSDGGDNAGGFNKWCKVLGGCTPESGPAGDALLFSEWAAAKAAYDHLYGTKPEMRNCFKIYPVVVIAGNEPRTTVPNSP